MSVVKQSKMYVWNPATCSCENENYLATIIDDSAIVICDEIIESCDEETKTIPTNFNERKATCKVQNIYILLTFLVTIALLIAVSICGYLIKYRAKQKNFHFTTQIMNLEKFYINKCIIKMSNKVNDMDTKNRTYYFFNVIINILMLIMLK